MNYKNFIRDYFQGFFRKKPKRPYSKEAIFEYFETLGRDIYLEKHAAVKDSLYFKRIFQSSIIKKSLLQPDVVVIDLGAGNGDLEKLIEIHPSGRVIMLDLSRNMLKAFESQNTDRFHKCVAEIESIPIKTKCVHIAFMINVTPYLEELTIVFKQVYDILDENGLFVLVEPICNRVWEDEFEKVRIKIWEEKTILSILNNFNFEIIEEEQLCFDFFPPFRVIRTTFAKFWLLKKIINNI
jgi:ubiquinone/menaquinone biosynthesis C-methylase UbiE